MEWRDGGAGHHDRPQIRREADDCHYRQAGGRELRDHSQQGRRQYLADKCEGVARTAESPEREALWAEACTQWPYFNDYQARTERKIPVVVLEPRRKLN
jgi:hypothetical protein